MMAMRSAKASIASCEGYIQGLCERNVSGVVSGESISQGPNSGQQCRMCMPFQGEIAEVVKRLLSGNWIKLFLADHAPYRVREFNVDEMGRMERFSRMQNHS